MTGNSKRGIRLLSWRTLRWAITLPALPLVWWACTSHPLAQPTPSPEQQTDIYVTVAPNRQLDLVFMVDNSPSMAPKVAKMNAQFPKLITALKDPVDGTLPDLRVALIDSDLGTGGAYTSGSCGPKNGGLYGDQGKFQMIDSVKCGMKSADSIFIEYKSGTALNYNGQIEDVFQCLATNLGTQGCGEEHQLQAFEFALAAQGVGTEDQQKAFLRPNAYLGLVFLSDEDDCSAAIDDAMFGSKPGGTDLSNESASLRCYSRSHKCNGKNLTDGAPGYPTTAAFSAPLSACAARMGDECPNPTDDPNVRDAYDNSKPTGCSPLKSIHILAQHIKDIKGSSASEQILVAGIFGWPIDVNKTDGVTYKIDQVPNPTPPADGSHATVWDSWPVCYDPNHKPSGNGFDTTAAGWGATAGLREKAFIDEFGDNGLAFSICQTDFSDSMKVIGDTIAKRLQNLCVDYKLYDTNPNQDGLQPSCRVVYRTPSTDDKGKVVWQENSESLPECKSGDTPQTVQSDCWRLVADKTKCPTTGQWIQIIRPQGSTPLAAGTKAGMQCRTCTDFKAPQGSEAYNACNY